MRRFPLAATGGQPGTPLRSQRSTEAPMQFEWTTPRTFPASPFNAPAGQNTLDDDSGERARKRTHYEAMDVDTPPRPVPALADLPPSATASTIPFNLEKTTAPPPSAADAHPLEFDATAFEATKAFGVEQEEPSADDDGNKSLTFLGRFRGESATAEPRRRRAAAAQGGRRKAAASHDDDDDDVDDVGEPRSRGMMGMLSGGRAVSGSEFSFQVHHHHGASGASQGGPDGDFSAAAPGWFHSQTPYTLLGYLQFASLTLLAVLFLSISLLFLYTLYTDVQDRLSSLSLEISAEILQCAKAYVDNNCAPKTRMPALARQCAGWEECMGRDATVVGKTRVVAETLAEVVNGFVDVISFKTMLFVLASLGLTIYGSSVALSVLPARPAPAAASPAYPQPPQFQHLGYHPPPYGYHPLSPPIGYGAPWPAMGDGSDGAAGSRGLGAPPVQTEKSEKGWLK